MKFLCVLVFFSVLICHSQNPVSNYITQAETALASNDLIKARDAYKKIVALKPNVRDHWFDLATIELNLAEKDSACKHFYRAHILHDKEATAFLKNNCPDFKLGTLLPSDIQGLGFIYNNQAYDLLVDGRLNEVYSKLLDKAISRSLHSSGILATGKFKVRFSMTSTKMFCWVAVDGPPQVTDEMAKSELRNIILNLVKYTPHKYKGVPIDFQDYILPLVLG